MRAIREFKQYFNYAKYSAIAELKTQVADSYLGWVWWILDPLLFMLVYSFMTIYIFKSNIEHVWLFVFSGITIWNFFNSTVASSIGAIRSYSSVILKTYVPKITIIFMIATVNLIKMFISLGICIVSSFIVGVDNPLFMLNIIPLLITFCIFTYGVSLICAFIGIYIADFSNVMLVILRFLFYLSGVFYNADVFSGVLQKVYNMLCPTGFMISQFRRALMLSQPMDYLGMLYWAIIGIIFIVIGTSLLYKKENEFMKVI